MDIDSVCPTTVPLALARAAAIVPINHRVEAEVIGREVDVRAANVIHDRVVECVVAEHVARHVNVIEEQRFFARVVEA